MQSVDLSCNPILSLPWGFIQFILTYFGELHLDAAVTDAIQGDYVKIHRWGVISVIFLLPRIRTDKEIPCPHTRPRNVPFQMWSKSSSRICLSSLTLSAADTARAKSILACISVRKQRKILKKGSPPTS